MLDKLIEHAPSLAAMVAIVVLFLRHMGKVSDQDGKRQDGFVRVVKDNTEALTALKTLIEERIPRANDK